MSERRVYHFRVSLRLLLKRRFELQLVDCGGKKQPVQLLLLRLPTLTLEGAGGKHKASVVTAGPPDLCADLIIDCM